jgi:hypothetical protein
VQEDGDAAPAPTKAGVAPPEEGASYGTARVSAGIQTSERPIGSTSKLGAELRVWTTRMLAALKTGVKGGKWYSLIDKVYPEAALPAAFARAASPRAYRRNARQIEPPQPVLLGEALDHASPMFPSTPGEVVRYADIQRAVGPVCHHVLSSRQLKTSVGPRPLVDGRHKATQGRPSTKNVGQELRGVARADRSCSNIVRSIP